MMKVFVGIGILATPASFAQVGVVGGVLGMILIGVTNMYTMKLQIASKLKIKQPISSYSDLGDAVFGARGKGFVDFCIMMS